MIRPRAAKLLAVLLVTSITACVRPGVKAEGSGEGAWGGERPVRLSGACVYDVTTKWGATYNHVLELSSNDGDERITVARRRAWTSGTWALETEGEGRDAIGTALEGNTVRGAIRGEIRIEEVGDSLIATIRGEKVFRDTVPLTATCRLGPVAD